MADDETCLAHFLAPIKLCRNYKPKFGNSKKKDGYSYDEFNHLYNTDPFYSWMGLNSKLMYSAHKAAGGMTSIYRQIGIGCERLFRAIIIDACQYNNTDFATWSYNTKTKAGKTKKLSLDARMELKAINNNKTNASLVNWISLYCSKLNMATLQLTG